MKNSTNTPLLRAYSAALAAIVLAISLFGCADTQTHVTTACKTKYTSTTDDSLPTVPNSPSTPAVPDTDTSTPTITVTTAPTSPTITDPVYESRPERWDPLAPLVSEHMPILSINTENSAKIESKTEYISATVSADGAPEKFCFDDLSAQVRCRGNYTYMFSKKSYRLKFDEKINLFGQDEGKARNWLLLTNGPDRSLLHNDTAYAMASVLTELLEVTSSGYVRLYVNGVDRGIYQLLEQHSTSSHRVAIDEDPDTLDSDYLIELDSYADGVDEVDYVTVDGKKFVIKNDKVHEGTLEFIKGYLSNVANAISVGDENAICSLIDVNSFVDTYILQEFIMNIDGGWSSFYMVKDAGGKLRCTWPWDFDLGFGGDERLSNLDGSGTYIGNAAYRYWDNQHPWFYRLMSQKWFVDRVTARWNEVGKKMVDTGLARLDLVYGQWGDDLLHNFDVWDHLGKYFTPMPYEIYSLTDYSKVVARLRSWIEKRYLWLDDYFHKLN